MNNLTDPEYIKQLFKQHGLRPRHYLGQNFLVDEEVLAEVVETAALSKNDTVLEVGPGIGTLTVELAKRAKKVIAVEKDERMVEILHHTLSDLISPLGTRGEKGGLEAKRLNLTPPTPSYSKRGLPNAGDPESSSGLREVKLINQDILRFNLEKEIKGPYKVVANIPYYLTSNLLRHFLTQKNKPSLLVLMVQKEVGERIVAPAGELSILGISVQVFSDAEIAASVSKNSFWPKPKVDSVILRIEPRIKYPQITDYGLFFRILKIAFAGKRKQIKNTIRNQEALQKAKINPTSRPQDLTIEQWVGLYK
ncbi:MAG: 16S rRNA (adenine(1518)-N(6)/adenine(1519)-N(6))-dimethyltransferase [Candidatus Doudnabacteria bacterium]|nr:16S rRNA (adenine(1518)-N(6)/adenine(1519)-N(6))-dimethyltransferase [Candidatus Doudnabacteria bacterium]